MVNSWKKFQLLEEPRQQCSKTFPGRNRAVIAAESSKGSSSGIPEVSYENFAGSREFLLVRFLWEFLLGNFLEISWIMLI